MNQIKYEAKRQAYVALISKLDASVKISEKSAKKIVHDFTMSNDTFDFDTASFCFDATGTLYPYEVKLHAVTPVQIATMAVISTDRQKDIDNMQKQFKNVVNAPLNSKASYQTTLPFNGKMFIDLGLSGETDPERKNKLPMWLGSMTGDLGTIVLDFQDDLGNSVHTFKFVKPNGYHGAFIEFDGDKHNAGKGKYKIDIYGTINIDNGVFSYAGEYRIHQNQKWNGLESKSWKMSDFDTIRQVRIALETKSSYDMTRIPLYIEY
jgi:hypothetical protein